MHERAVEFRERARAEHGFDPPIQEFGEGETRTVEAAAEQLGCAPAQIAASIVVMADDDPVLVVKSGAGRVDLDRVGTLLGADAVRTADPEEVQAATGWSIGGVPPFCHEEGVSVIVDEALFGYETVYAAAGTPETLFAVDPDRIAAFTDGEVVAITE
ncbi:MAG: YbaK/EbsC family protein [Halobacteriaceae archaeon]